MKAAVYAVKAWNALLALPWLDSHLIPCICHQISVETVRHCKLRHDVCDELHTVNGAVAFDREEVRDWALRGRVVKVMRGGWGQQGCEL